MIQKVRVRWVAKGNAIAQARFLAEFFGVAAKLQVDFKPLGLALKVLIRILAMKPPSVIQ